jgi:hypothetical protein
MGKKVEKTLKGAKQATAAPALSVKEPSAGSKLNNFFFIK